MRTIDEINNGIASEIDSAIEEPWLQATVVFEHFGDATTCTGRYLDEAEEIEKSFRCGRKMADLFAELHQLTTAESFNQWNKARFVLGADSQFTLEFEQDEKIDKAARES